MLDIGLINAPATAANDVRDDMHDGGQGSGSKTVNAPTRISDLSEIYGYSEVNLLWSFHVEGRLELGDAQPLVRCVAHVIFACCITGAQPSSAISIADQ